MMVAPRYEGPPIISIAGPPDDQLVPVVRQRRRLAAMLVDLREDDWRSGSRCDAWTVQDVVSHLVGVNVFWRASVLAGLAGTPTRVLAGFDPATTPALMVAPMRELTPTAVLDQFIESNEAFLSVLADLDDAGWAMLAESPAGHVPIRLIASHALWDCWIHERDIALPLGLTPSTEPDEVEASLRYAAALSPALAIATGHVLTGRFAVQATNPELSCVLEVGESVAVRDEITPREAPCLRGDAVALIEALSIRAPLPAATPSAWVGLLDGLATAFTAELQGS
ncbi:MAG: maleylpyruvate isomerase family mycothiol-dependent enzyme [Acidimicrobiia bacterium]